MKPGAVVTATSVALTLALNPWLVTAANPPVGGMTHWLADCWSLGWVTRILTASLSQPAALANLWNGNIYFPETHTLAFSNPAIVQAFLTLPIYRLTGDLIWCVKAMCLAASALAGLGSFLLVRSIVSDGRSRNGHRMGIMSGGIAALLVTLGASAAGMAGDIHTLSLALMPFAMLAFHRFLASDSRAALVAGTAILSLANLASLDQVVQTSAGVGVFVLIDLVRLRRWPLRVWLELWASAATVALLSLAVATTYADARRHAAPDRPSDEARSTQPDNGLQPPPAYLAPSGSLPAIYRDVEQLSSDAILLELPFGFPDYDARYMFFAAVHGRRIANGRTPIVPASYSARKEILANPLLDPEATARTIAGMTHVIVHTSAWRTDTGKRLAIALQSRGGQLVASADGALLYQMQTAERLARARQE